MPVVMLSTRPVYGSCTRGTKPRTTLSGFSSASSRSARATTRPRVVRVLAFRDTDDIHDWRTKDMVLKVQQFFGEFVNKGNKEVISALFDEDVVHLDIVWGSTQPAVGHAGLAHYLDDLKSTFPDFHVGVDNLRLAQASLTSLWVRLEGNCTGLGSFHHHQAIKHANHFEAVALFDFNKDRSKITHIEVFRTAFAEDKSELQTVVSEGGFRELRLKRLT